MKILKCALVVRTLEAHAERRDGAAWNTFLCRKEILLLPCFSECSQGFEIYFVFCNAQWQEAEINYSDDNIWYFIKNKFNIFAQQI